MGGRQAKREAWGNGKQRSQKMWGLWRGPGRETVNSSCLPRCRSILSSLYILGAVKASKRGQAAGPLAPSPPEGPEGAAEEEEDRSVNEMSSSGDLQGIGGCSGAPPAEPPPPSKLCLGGFRNLRTGAEYHHACTQTALPPELQPKGEGSPVCSAAQASETKAHSMQTCVDAATQCSRPGWHDADAGGTRVLLPTGA